jgi:EmrB/QacA subfamily drug resistance transporter
LNWTAWTITIYQLGLIVVMPLAGKFSDQFGRKRIFVIAIVIFTTSSLLCGLSTNIYMLIPLRLLQAIGGGAFTPSASGIVADHFGADRDRALGMFSSIFPIGGIIGPSLGGPIAAAFGWRAIFFFNVPFGILLFILATRFLPSGALRKKQALDVRGVAILVLSLVCAMVAITLLGERGMSPLNARFLVPLIAAIVGGRLFLVHSRRAAAPFIPIELLTGKGFGMMNLINMLFGTAVLGFGVLVPLYAENRYHIGIAEAGTIFSARAVGMVSIAAVATFMLRRTGYRRPMAVGFTAIAVGIAMLSIAPRGLSPYWWLALFSMVTGLGMGIAIPATNNAALQLAPDRVGAIAGLRGMFRQIGGIFYVSITTSIIARSTDPGIAQSHLFLVQAAVVVVMVGLVARVPEHRGSW